MSVVYFGTGFHTMRLQALFAGIAVAGLAATGACAADILRMQPAPAYNSAAFNFDGFYLGAQGGGVVGGFSAGSIGVVAGANFSIADAVVAGAEFQADSLFNSSSSATYDFFALGRLGVVVTNDLLLYADAGPGWVGGAGSYAFGGGGEYAVTDVLSVKAEAFGVGAWNAGPSSAKLQAGLLFHMQ